MNLGVQEIPREDWPQSAGRMTLEPSRMAIVGGAYLVQVFQEPDGITRLTVCGTNATRSRMGKVRFSDGIPWDHLQEVKRIIGYGKRDAVEVYPPDDDLVDMANMRHLWVLPYRLPFAWRA